MQVATCDITWRAPSVTVTKRKRFAIKPCAVIAVRNAAAPTSNRQPPHSYFHFILYCCHSCMYLQLVYLIYDNICSPPFCNGLYHTFRRHISPLNSLRNNSHSLQVTSNLLSNWSNSNYSVLWGSRNINLTLFTVKASAERIYIGRVKWDMHCSIDWLLKLHFG